MALPLLPLALGTIFSRLLTMYIFSKIGAFIMRVVGFVGVQLATYNLILAPLIAQAEASLSGIGGNALLWIGFFQIDKCLTIILSAYTIAQFSRVFVTKAPQ